MAINVWIIQKWYDHKLRWDPQEYGGIDQIDVPADQLWLPDIILYNSADGYVSVALSIMTKAKVWFDGRVEWNAPAIFKSSCQIDVEYFPFDTQTCKLKFGSWTHDGNQLNLRHLNETDAKIDKGIDLSGYYRNVEWDISEASAQRNIKTYVCCPNVFYPDVTFQVTLKRKSLFYTVNLILPCFAITTLSLFVFYLPSHSGEKVTLTTSILVSLTLFLSILIETIPSTSLAMPLLGKFLVFTMILIAVSVCATVFVLNVHFRTPSTHSMSPTLKRYAIEVLPKYLLLNTPQLQNNLSSQDNIILPENLIYPHNNALSRDALALNLTQADAVSSNNQQLLPTTDLCQQRTHSSTNLLLLHANSSSTSNNQTSATTSTTQYNNNNNNLRNNNSNHNTESASPLLPYLQSEAARRLLSQRSKSSDRDRNWKVDEERNCDNNEVGECFNQTINNNKQTRNIKQTNNTSKKKKKKRLVFNLLKFNHQSTTKNDSNNNSSGEEGDQVNGISDNYNYSRNKERGRHELNDDDNDKQSQLSQTIDSNNYQYHRNYQKRASVCNINPWRIGPRRCSITSPSLNVIPMQAIQQQYQKPGIPSGNQEQTSSNIQRVYNSNAAFYVPISVPVQQAVEFPNKLTILPINQQQRQLPSQQQQQQQQQGTIPSISYYVQNNLRQTNNVQQHANDNQEMLQRSSLSGSSSTRQQVPQFGQARNIQQQPIYSINSRVPVLSTMVRSISSDQRLGYVEMNDCSNQLCKQEQNLSRALGQAYEQRLQRQAINGFNCGTNIGTGVAIFRSSNSQCETMTPASRLGCNNQTSCVNINATNNNRMPRSKSQNWISSNQTTLHNSNDSQKQIVKQQVSKLKANQLPRQQSSTSSRDKILRRRMMRNNQNSILSADKLLLANNSNNINSNLTTTNNQSQQLLGQTTIQQSNTISLNLIQFNYEVDKAIQNAMFIAQHIDNLDEFESVKENWKYIAMVIDRIFLIVFVFACIIGSVSIFSLAPSFYDEPEPLGMKSLMLDFPSQTGTVCDSNHYA